MLVARNDKVINGETFTYNDTVEFNMDDFDQGSVQLVCVDATPGVKTFTDTDVTVLANTVTIAAHGFLTGLKVVTTTSGAAPGGLSAGTYYIIKVDAATIKFATSAANAFAGTAVDITTAGGVGDTQTITPAALGTCAIDLYASNDGTNYVTLSVGSGNFTAGTVKLLPILDKFYKYLQLVLTVPAGALTVTATVYGKSYKY
jgi:hypothetical protein